MVRLEKRGGWWFAVGTLLGENRETDLAARVSKREAKQVGEDFFRITNAARAIANRYMGGEIERIQAVAEIEKIAGVRDVFEARFLLQSACGEVQ